MIFTIHAHLTVDFSKADHYSFLKNYSSLWARSESNVMLRIAKQNPMVTLLLALWFRLDGITATP
jgi:hypothetical protein